MAEAESRDGLDSGGDSSDASGSPTMHGSAEEPSAIDSGPPSSRAVQAGKVIAALVTFVAAVGGLILGIKADMRASDDGALARQAQQKTYADHVDFYRRDVKGQPPQMIVVNGNSHAMDMRLVLGHPSVWWDLLAISPCTQVVISDRDLLKSMALVQPDARLTAFDLDSVQLEFIDPSGRSWRRLSAGRLSRSHWDLQGADRSPHVSSEDWNLKKNHQDSPTCN